MRIPWVINELKPGLQNSAHRVWEGLKLTEGTKEWNRFFVGINPFELDYLRTYGFVKSVRHQEETCRSRMACQPPGDPVCAIFSTHLRDVAIDPETHAAWIPFFNDQNFKQWKRFVCLVGLEGSAVPPHCARRLDSGRGPTWYLHGPYDAEIRFVEFVCIDGDPISDPIDNWHSYVGTKTGDSRVNAQKRFNRIRVHYHTMTKWVSSVDAKFDYENKDGRFLKELADLTIFQQWRSLSNSRVQSTAPSESGDDEDHQTSETIGDLDACAKEIYDAAESVK